ncbi:TetR family transcriptional regulator C-terminal domain-containing protein [Arthrobacter sp. B6]|uniref:TetR family transcriptional regulator C-terminal domain-containing protein n=1 Tax=Arthrobacter sp. B6 TaxID=1570137 RepID=UPI003FA43F97
MSVEATSPDHPAHEYYQERYKSVVDLYNQAFVTLAAHGEVNGDMPPEDLAVAFVAFTDGLQIQWLYDRDMDHYLQHGRQFLRWLIPGVG